MDDGASTAHPADAGPSQSVSNTVFLWLLAVFGAIGVSLALAVNNPDPIDLLVYRSGGTLLLNGDALYVVREGLPFTYAPFAAVVFVPLALIPWPFSVVMVTALSVLALGRAIWLLLCQVKGSKPTPAVFAVAGILALVSEPMLANLGFGQVNAFLLWLVVEDILGPRTSRIGGVLTGVAAGIKLTPGIFMLMFLVAGAYRRFALATVAFLATSVIAFPFLGSQVFDFWTEVTWNATRVGKPEFASNQSINGGMWRLFGPDPNRVIWLLVAVLVVALAMWGARVEWRRSRLRAVGLGSLAMLLASPISWTHHWVWAIPPCVVLWQQRQRLLAKILLGSGVVLFVTGLPMLLPRGDGIEFGWTPIQQLAGNSYLIWALLTFFYLVYVALLLKPTDAGGPDAVPSSIEPAEGSN
jgi:alpha-1,2-mannosyltransferase